MRQRRRVGLTAGWLTVLCVVVAAGLTGLGTASAAPSIVPGKYTLTITAGDGAIGIKALSIGPACSNGVDDDLDTKVDYPADAECASPTDSNEGPDNTPYVAPTFTVDLDAAGNVSASAADVHWQDIWQRQNAGPLGVKDLLIRFKADDVAGKSVTGHIDAVTGAIDLTWRFHIETSIVGVPGTLQIGSPDVPLTANLSTGGTGGAAFDPSSLSATLVDSTIVYPSAVCVGNALLCPTMVTQANSQLGLPTSPGQSTLKVTGAVDRNPIKDDVDPPPEAPDLKVVKTHSGDFTVGAAGVYTVTVTNVGTAATSGQIVLGDALPDGMALGGATGDGWACLPVDTKTVGCTSSDPIAVDASAPPVVVTATPDRAGTLTNVAFVTVDGDTNPDNDTASDPTTVTGGGGPGEPDLVLAKSHEGNFVVDTQGSYTLAVSNVGSAASSGDVVVSDTLPAGMSFVSGTGTDWNCAAEGQVVSCTSPAAIAPGAAAAPVTLAVMPVAAGDVTNTASVAGGGQTNNLNDGATDPTTVTGAASEVPDLTLAKTHTGDFVVGTKADYSLKVSNIGPVESSGEVVVADTLPEAMTFSASSGEGWGCTATGKAVECTTSESVAAGGSAKVLTISVMPTAAGSFTNVASVSGGGEENTLNNGATDSTKVVAAPTPNLVVDVAAPAMVVGTPSTIVAQVSNVGTGPTTGPVSLALPLPTAFTLTSATGSGWSCSNAGADGSTVQIACVTQASVAAGAKLPVVSVAVTPKQAGTFPIGAKVRTDGDISTDDDSKVVQVEVVASGSGGATASDLPFTGGDLGILVTAAVAAFGSGGALVRFSRRRRRGP